MVNPYDKSGKTYALTANSNPIVGNGELTGGRKTRAGYSHSNEPLVSSNGSVNASSKKDMMQQISALITAAASGKIAEVSKLNQMKTIASDHKELIQAAKADKNGLAFTALGQAIGDEIWETENRQGLARSILLVKPLEKSEDGKFRIRRKDVMSFVATGPSKAIESHIRQDWVYPKEFYIHAQMWIDLIQLRQDTGDLLEDKYVDGLEQIMVSEDKLLKILSDRAAQVRNDLVVFNTLSPQVFTSLRTQIIRWNVTPATAIIAVDLWDDIIADPTFTAWYSPVEKHQVILEGNLGSMLNVDIKTDGYRYDTLRVLDDGEIYMYGTPQTVGGIAQGTELTAEPINNFINGKPQTGWYLYQTEGMVIANANSVSKGLRA